MRFSAILASVRGAEGQYSATVPDSWTQGRTLFGGLQAALAVRAMRNLVPAGIPLRSLQTTFIAPVPPGELRIEARVLRQGKSAVHAEARLMDGMQVACLVVAVFGAARESALRLQPSPLQLARDFESLKDFPFIPNVTPAFTQHVRMRWAVGSYPFKGGAEARTQIYVSLRDTPETGEEQVVSLADIIPSPGLSVLTRPCAASSMTWMLELLTDRIDEPADAPWVLDTVATSAADGYLSQTGTLWSPSGAAVAYSRQSVVVFG